MVILKLVSVEAKEEVKMVPAFPGHLKTLYHYHDDDDDDDDMKEENMVPAFPRHLITC